MNVTSSEANKELRRYKDELSRLQAMERQSATFTVATTESAPDARPEYDFVETQAKIDAIQQKVRTIKHAINEFNVTHCPEDFDMTVDEMLVYIPQLTAAKSKYKEMVTRMPKKRKDSGYSRSSLIEYEYTNYSIEAAQAFLDKVTAELTKAQLALDRLNTTVKFEIDI